MWWITIIINFLLSVILTTKLLHLYQLNGYKIKCDIVTLMAVFYIILTGVIAIVIQQIMLIFLPNLSKIVGYILSLLPILTLCAINIIEKKKVTLAYTSRMLRQYTVNLILLSSSIIAIRYLSKTTLGDYLCLTSLDFVIIPLIYLVAIAVVYPLERMIRKGYIKRAKIALSRPNLIKIGVTGSYGKTTVKNILAQMLSTKYRVVATPASYNTPMGIAKACELLDDKTEVFIAEMGARNVGDIAELVDIVRPSIGIITGIAEQHLETFGSLEKIMDTKNELIEGLPKDGVAFYNGDSKHINTMYYKSPLANKNITYTHNGYAHLESIKVSNAGSSFILCVGNEKKPCYTKLLGKHNLSNITLATSLASKLGVSLDSVCKACQSLNYEPHRMEVINANNGVTIIDDSYNSNVEGARCAIETLSLFSGKRVVVSQGIVELGDMEDRANYNIGMMLSSTCDILFAVGKRGKLIARGMLDAGGNPTKIIYAKSLSEAQAQFSQVLSRGDVLLIMNDLPDNY